MAPESPEHCLGVPHPNKEKSLRITDRLGDLMEKVRKCRSSPQAQRIGLSTSIFQEDRKSAFECKLPGFQAAARFLAEGEMLGHDLAGRVGPSLQPEESELVSRGDGRPENGWARSLDLASTC